MIGICLPEGASKDDITVSINTPDDIWMTGDQLKFVDSLDQVATDRFMQKLYLKDR